jgi:hypothetical protein
MIVIQRRYNGTDYEQIAVYQDGELTGDDDFIESFGDLFEGEIDESAILQQFSGPNLVASVPPEDTTDSESPTEHNRGERPDDNASAAEIAEWMEEDFGEALADGMDEATTENDGPE